MEGKLNKKDKIFLISILVGSSIVILGGVAYIMYKRPDAMTRVGSGLTGNLRGSFEFGKAFGRREVFDAFMCIDLSNPKIISAVKSRSLEKISEVITKIK